MDVFSSIAFLIIVASQVPAWAVRRRRPRAALLGGVAALLSPVVWWAVATDSASFESFLLALLSAVAGLALCIAQAFGRQPDGTPLLATPTARWGTRALTLVGIGVVVVGVCILGLIVLFVLACQGQDCG